VYERRENLEPNLLSLSTVEGLWAWVILDVWGLCGKGGKGKREEVGEEGGRVSKKEYF